MRYSTNLKVESFRFPEWTSKPLGIDKNGFPTINGKTMRHIRTHENVIYDILGQASKLAYIPSDSIVANFYTFHGTFLSRLVLAPNQNVISYAKIPTGMRIRCVDMFGRSVLSGIVYANQRQITTGNVGDVYNLSNFMDASIGSVGRIPQSHNINDLGLAISLDGSTVYGNPGDSIVVAPMKNDALSPKDHLLYLTTDKTALFFARA